MRTLLCVFLAVVVFVTAPETALHAQTPAPQAAAVSDLTPEQQNLFDQGGKLFQQQHYAEVIPLFEQLLQQLKPHSPQAILVTKYLAESAINSDKRDLALSWIKPLAADANDGQVAGLLARIYAETGQKQLRDAEIAHLIDLHQRAVNPIMAHMQTILLERVVTENGSLRIWYSLEPWGRFKTHLWVRIYDKNGQELRRIALESSDFDQPTFAKQHPDLAAKGVRIFTLDGYSVPVKNADGTTSGAHSTYDFFQGKPDYDELREQIVAIANGKPYKQLSISMFRLPEKTGTPQTPAQKP